MSERLVHLAVRIRDELAELDYVADRVAKAWEHALSVGDDYDLDSVALNLHGFYSGLERIADMRATVKLHKQPIGSFGLV